MPTPIPFGRYLLLRQLALGGMAELFLAKLPGVAGFEKTVVIKRILPHWSTNKEFITMLIDEAKIVVQLTHPNIVSVYELGKEVESYYIAMEYVEGVDLRRLTQACQKKGKKLPLALSLFIIQEVLRGLSYAHKKTDHQGKALRVVHRDISPQNILLSYEGMVKVADFGIARAADRSHETATGTLKGKFSYMSPEQASQQPLDARSDLFSVGILLFELVTGRKLFGQKTDIGTLDEVRKAEVLWPADIQIEESLKAILSKSLAKEATGRFQEAAEFVQELHAWARQHGEEGTSEKLGSFLKELFAHEIKNRHQEQGKLPLEGTPILKSGRTKIFVSKIFSSIVPNSKIFFSRKKLIGLGMVILLALLAILISSQFFKSPNEKPTLKIAEQSTIAQSPTPEEVALEGKISIQAIPWATAAIDDQPLTDTPLHKKGLAPGTHLVKLYYQPQNKTLLKEVVVPPGGSVRCLIDFSESEEKWKCH
ncbi:MAG: serine/threonine-protein kinase [Deltaproteobacteria bacterium]|nr:serine/threonine-protein kinase [Deltaproteobacteria bacterium]